MGGLWLYLLMGIPPLLLGLWAQWRVRASFNKYSQVSTSTGMSGAQMARRVLDSQGLSNVQVEEVGGFLSDHYDPGAKVLRLSPDVYNGRTVAAAGVAAHEAGHALQDAKGYTPLILRSAMVPTVQFGSWLGPIMFFIGYFMNFTSLAWLGVLLFGAMAVFALVTLPVEFDASARARKLLVSQGVLFPDEMNGVNAVLNAAALTYVAAAVQAVTTLLYYVFLLVGSNND